MTELQRHLTATNARNQLNSSSKTTESQEPARKHEHSKKSGNGLKLPALQSALMSPPLVRHQPWFMLSSLGHRGNTSSLMKENLSKEEKLRSEIMSRSKHYGANLIRESVKLVTGKCLDNGQTDHSQNLNASQCTNSAIMGERYTDNRRDVALAHARDNNKVMLTPHSYDVVTHSNNNNTMRNLMSQMSPTNHGNNERTNNMKMAVDSRPPQLYPETPNQVRGHGPSQPISSLSPPPLMKALSGPPASMSSPTGAAPPPGSYDYRNSPSQAELNTSADSMSPTSPTFSQMRDVIHASTVSTLKDKIMKRIDSQENLATSRNMPLLHSNNNMNNGKDVLVRDLNSNISAALLSSTGKDSLEIISKKHSDVGSVEAITSASSSSAYPSVMPAFASSSSSGYFPAISYPSVHPALMYQVSQYAAAQQLAMQHIQQQQLQQLQQLHKLQRKAPAMPEAPSDGESRYYILMV